MTIKPLHKPIRILAVALFTTTFALAATAWEWDWKSNNVQGSGTVISETRAVSGYTGLALSVPAKLELNQNGKEGITISADDNILPLLETVVEDNTLRIRWKDKGTSIKPATLNITLDAKTIEQLAVAGSGEISSAALKSAKLKTNVAGSGKVSLKNLDAETLNLSVAGSGNFQAASTKASQVKASVAGSGDVKLDTLETQSLSVNVAGSGDFKAAGHSKDSDISISGSGDINIGNLESKKSKISIAGSGDVVVWATDALTVSIAGSGTVKYYGDSTQVQQSTVGSGKVIRIAAAPR
ncbi:MAG: DUF2807 domain-containing protein [Betaproteobacteria bacterium]|nr:DUF2807 domain-containing protein [Betaproteobacteria bacterium]